jgi:hypothetical protein
MGQQICEEYSVARNGSLFSGRTSGYQGSGTKSDLGNHSQQLNTNNPKFQDKK